jgi:hypothetical protein
MNLYTIFLIIAIVLLGFFLLGIFLPIALNRWSVLHRPIPGYIEDARDYIYKICIFLSILLFVSAFVLLFIAAYMQNPTGKSFINTLSLLFFGLFFSCLEGIVFYLGYTFSRKKFSYSSDVTMENALPRVSTFAFVLFYLGAMTLLSYPIVMFAQWISLFL